MKPSIRSGGILRPLVFYHIDKFGPLAPQFFLALLAGMTGFTSSPVCIRTIGDSEIHSEIGLHLEELLGSSSVCYITSTTESGIVGLGTQDQVRLIVFEGMNSDGSILASLDRLIRRKPIRTLDAPLGNDIRVRAFDRPICVILLDAGVIDDRALIRHLLTVKLQDSSGSLPLQLDRSFSHFTPGMKRNRRIRNRKRAKLAKTLSHLDRTIMLKAPDISPEIMQHISDAGDGERLRQVIALAYVVSVLMGCTRTAAGPRQACVLADAVDFVIQLLELASVIDERAPLADAPQQTLDELRSMVKPPKSPVKLYKSSASSDTDRSTKTTPDPTVFTAAQLHRRQSHSGIGLSAIHDRLKVLENREFIEPLTEKRGRQKQWRLTVCGFDPQQKTLSTLLRRLYPTSTASQSEFTPLIDALKKGGSSGK